ncbi:unnamed protein product [Amaranthus hypochondriacus]
MAMRRATRQTNRQRSPDDFIVETEDSSHSQDFIPFVQPPPQTNGMPIPTIASLPQAPPSGDQWLTFISLLQTQQQQLNQLQQQLQQNNNATPTTIPIPTPTPATPQIVILGPNVVTVQTQGIQRLAPKRYDGKGQPAKLHDWIREMDKIFELLETPDRMKVNLAAHYLTGDADTWWLTHRDAVKSATARVPTSSGSNPTHATASWSQFIAAIRDEFFPIHLQREMRDDFSSLRQDDRTVHQFYSRFIELAAQVEDMTTGEESRAQHFFRGLNLEVRKYMVSRCHTTVRDAYNDACSAERLLFEEGGTYAQLRRRGECNEAPQGSRKRHHPDIRQHSSSQRSRPPRQDQSTSTRQQIECFHCGKKGHKKVDCYTYLRELEAEGKAQDRSQRPVASQTSVGQDRNQGRSQAFKGRGQSSHGTQMDSSRPATSVPAKGAQTTGRLMALKRDEAEETLQVVSGDDFVEEPF